MIHLTYSSKIYILTPRNYATGGIELCYQFADYVSQQGIDCYMVFFNGKQELYKDNPVDNYRRYSHIKGINHIEDSVKNLLILPESFPTFLKSFNSIQIAFWWMSVDNYFSRASFQEYFLFNLKCKRYRRALSAIKHFRERPKTSFLKLMKKNETRIVHLYQSEYANIFLKSHDIYNTLPLGDYINTDLLSDEIDISHKENIILYNPKKGYSFTKKVIRVLPEYKFIALKGFANSQLHELYKKAKVYIDFGNHPGKDRIPREAAMGGCCVVVGKEGSAKYFEDVPISEIYKFEKNNLNLPKIRNIIVDLIVNYEKRVGDFSFYRKRIMREKKEFYDEIDNFLQFIQ